MAAKEFENARDEWENNSDEWKEKAAQNFQEAASEWEKDADDFLSQFGDRFEKMAEQIEEDYADLIEDFTPDSEADIVHEDENGQISIDFLKAFETLGDYFEQSGIQNKVEHTLDEFEEELEQMEPELEEWFSDHWEDQWLQNSGDRWDIRNQHLGWGLDDIREEFDDFFSKNDANLISDGGASQQKFELELKKMMNLYDKGIESGKVDAPQGNRPG